MSASNRKGLIDPDKNKKDGTIWREAVGDEGIGTIRLREKEREQGETDTQRPRGN